MLFRLGRSHHPLKAPGVGWLAWWKFKTSARHQNEILSRTQSIHVQRIDARDLSNEPLPRKFLRDSLTSNHFQWRQWATFLIFCFWNSLARFWWAVGIFWMLENVVSNTENRFLRNWDRNSKFWLTGAIGNCVSWVAFIWIAPILARFRDLEA